MPYYRKKRVYRKKRSVKRYRRKYSRIPRKSLGNPNQKVYYFTRYASLGEIQVAATGNQYGGSVFSLDQVPGYAEYTAMFDFYKIKAVKIQFVPASDITLGTSVPSYETRNFDRIFTAIDYNDAGVVTSVDTIRQYKNCKWSSRNIIHTRYFKPRIVVDQGSTDIEYRAQPWVSSTNYDQDYYSIKWAIENNASVGTKLYRIEAKFYLAFKSPN